MELEGDDAEPKRKPNPYCLWGLRATVEQNAVELEGDDAERRRLPEAIVRVVTEKGIVTPAELREIIEQVDSLGQKMLGRQLVVRAWMEPDFRQLLLEVGTAPSCSKNKNRYGFWNG